MASDDTMTILQLHSPTIPLEDEDEIDDGNDEDDHHHHTPRSLYLSRLSMCTTSSSGSKPPTLTPNMYDDDDAGGDIIDMGMDMARLSIEGSSEGYADEELSDGKEGGSKGVSVGMSSDSDKEMDCYSLPATPPRRRRARPFEYGSGNLLSMGLKEYASENEAQRRTTTPMRRRRLAGPAMRDGDSEEVGVERAWDENKYGNVKDEEEEEEDGGSECVVKTRPKGGKKYLCMDLEEVKACRDLGFELDHERMMMVDTPTPRISVSISAASTIDFDTSSGGNSPIANWRISSPGDDPRDVKARLKVWAQAVALASTSFSTR